MKKIAFLTVLLLVCFSAHVFAENPINPIKKLFEEGMVAMQRSQYQKAISLFEKTIEIAPEFAPSYNYLGMCHRELGAKPADLIWMFEQAVKFNPNYAQAWDNLSRLYYSEGRFEDAKNACEKALEIKPDMLSAQMSLGWIHLLGFSEPQEAIFYFNQILENYDMPYAQFGLGMAHFMDREKFKALEMITELKSMNQVALAKQLENLVRSGYSKLPELTPGEPLFRTKTQLQQPFNASFIDKLQEVHAERAGDMKVRLKVVQPDNLEASTIPPVDTSISPAEKIRQLQQRAVNSN